MDELRVRRFCQWLEGHCGGVSKIRAALRKNEEIVRLEIDASELLNSFPNLGVALLQDPVAVAGQVMSCLGARGVGSSAPPCPPLLYFCLKCVPFPILSVERTSAVSMACPCNTPIRFRGAIHALSTPRKILFRRCLECNRADGCDGVEVTWPQEPPKLCVCGGQLVDNAAKGVPLDCQELVVVAPPQVLKRAVQAGASRSIHVILTGSLPDVRIGDDCDVFGYILNLSGSATIAPDHRMYQPFVIHANSIDLCPLSIRPQPSCPMQGIPTQGFPLPLEDDLLGTTATKDTCLLQTLCDSLQLLLESSRLPDFLDLYDSYSVPFALSLVLSLVAIDQIEQLQQGSEGFDSSSSNEISQRINLLVVDHCHCPDLRRALKIASSLAERSTAVASFAFRPNKLLGKLPDPNVAEGGILSSAAGGVALLDILGGPKNQETWKALSCTLTQPTVGIGPGGAFGVSCATVWCTHSAWPKRGKGLFRSETPCIQNFGDKMLQSIFDKFDVVLPHPLPRLRTAARKLQGTLKDCRQRLAEHLSAARQIPVTHSFCDGASDMIQSYFLYLRQAEVVELEKETRTLTLHSLLKIAEASARACLRTEVREFPDAVIAILLSELSLKAKVGNVSMSFLNDQEVLEEILYAPISDSFPLAFDGLQGMLATFTVEE